MSNLGNKMNRSGSTYNNTNINNLTTTNPRHQTVYPNNNNNNNNNNIDNVSRNSPTFSIHSAPFLNHHLSNEQQLPWQPSLINNQLNNQSNHELLSMINIKKLLERLKNEIDIERNKKTLIIKQYNNDIYKLTKYSKIENYILLDALKNAQNKAKLYRNEYYKLKTKVQTKYVNSEQENSKTFTKNNNTTQKTSMKHQSDWMINNNNEFHLILRRM
ncbi:unnamed protein product [Schistosoma rodhaini]|nr:unnamed protein product [Schistosoma rodhaini]